MRRNPKIMHVLVVVNPEIKHEVTFQFLTNRKIKKVIVRHAHFTMPQDTLYSDMAPAALN